MSADAGDRDYFIATLKNLESRIMDLKFEITDLENRCDAMGQEIRALRHKNGLKS